MTDPICPEHGWLSHLFIHEAAHAVAAVDRGIPFVRVRILPPAEWLTHTTGGQMVGGIELVDPHPRAWVPKDAAAALEFVLSGSLAEDVALGHCLDRSYEGDVRLWRIGLGATGELTGDELDGLVGESFIGVSRRTRVWVQENWRRIRHITRCLAGVDHISEDRNHIDASDGRELTQAEVIDRLRDFSGDASPTVG